MPVHRWLFRARPGRVIDGDTFVIEDIDLGFNMRIHSTSEKETERVRLEGVYCPELRHVGGSAARLFTLMWMNTAALPGLSWPLLIETDTDPEDNFGRYLGVVWRFVDGACLNDDLIRAGHHIEP
jgi:endonuclease YncB( thermonuclease family)